MNFETLLLILENTAQSKAFLLPFDFKGTLEEAFYTVYIGKTICPNLEIRDKINQRIKEDENFQIQIIIKEGPEYIGETIDRLCKDQSRLKFNQALLEASLKDYFLLQLAMLGNKNLNAYDTIKKWRESGLKLPEEGTPEFYPYDDKTQ